MKATKTLFIAALAVSSLLVLGSALQAQDQPMPAKPEGAPSPRRPGLEERVNHMAVALNLTEEQKGKVTTLYQEEAKKAKEVRGDSALTDDQKKEKRKALRDDFSNQMKSILTAEQFEKWQKMGPQGRGPRGPGGPPPEKKSEPMSTNTSPTTETQK